MTDPAGPSAWLRAANPLDRPATEAQARRAARLGAVSAVVMALQSVVEIAPQTERMQRMLAAMPSAMGAPSGDAEADAVLAATMDQVVAAIPPLMLGVSLVSAAVLLVLAAVQWRRPNAVIPGVLLAFTLYGLLSLPLTLLNPMYRELVDVLAMPPWRYAYAAASYVLHLVLLTAAFFGALRLGRLRAPPAAAPA
jgi:hypothetical protein